MYTKQYEAVEGFTGKLEGGYVNKPTTDRGKETLFGISRPNNPDWSGWVEVDAYADMYGRGTPEFIAAVNNDSNLKIKAKELFYVRYFVPISGDDLPFEIGSLVYDMAVNSGPATAVKMVQKVLIKMGVPTVKSGKFTHEEIEFINSAMEGDSRDVLLSLWFRKRLEFYDRIIASDKKGTQIKNRPGWVNRLRRLSEHLMGYIPETLLTVLFVLFTSLSCFAGELKVLDGDTFKVGNTVYRLPCIDAPEIMQIGGKESKQFLTDLLTGSEYTIEKTTIKDTLKKRQRIIARVRIKGNDISLIMLAQGKAFYSARHCDDASAELSMIDAKNNKVGFWGWVTVPEEPEEFRKKLPSYFKE